METQSRLPVDDETRERYIQVAVFLEDTRDYPYFSVDPWDNCPSPDAREEGRSCDECEFWGRRVESEDWVAFSLCRFREE